MENPELLSGWNPAASNCIPNFLQSVTKEVPLKHSGNHDKIFYKYIFSVSVFDMSF